MNGDPSPLPPLKYHTQEHRPPFERIALLLQGGGALGSYPPRVSQALRGGGGGAGGSDQAGVYQALAEANLHPDWVAGISIGAINAAVIAGNAPEDRVDRLRAFWDEITAPPPLWPGLAAALDTPSLSAAHALLFGQPGF